MHACMYGRPTFECHGTNERCNDCVMWCQPQVLNRAPPHYWTEVATIRLPADENMQTNCSTSS
jgi:hypothetical protein